MNELQTRAMVAEANARVLQAVRDSIGSPGRPLTPREQRRHDKATRLIERCHTTATYLLRLDELDAAGEPPP